MSNKKGFVQTKYKVRDLYEEEDFIKDCPNYEFIPTYLPPVKRIIAIGDIHGDFDLAVKSFKLAKLIDDNYNWIAEPPNTIVVQVGDLVDSCRPIPKVYECHRKKYPEDRADDINVVNFFNNMHEKASKVGGAVYKILGNHETMNAQGNFTYVSYENYYNFDYVDNKNERYQGPKGRQRSFEPGGPIANMLACTSPSVLIIGSTMFVHAGVLPVLARRLEYLNIDSQSKLKYLNAVVRKWLLNKISENELQNKSLFINDLKTSPFWTRIYGTIPENSSLKSSECFDSVKSAIEVYKIGHLVVGHTPQLLTNNSGINGTCYEKNKQDNKLYRIDGGFSKAFSILNNNQNLVQVLEIIDDKEFRILTDSNIKTHINPPEIGINDSEMKSISYIYSQNRTK